MRFVSLAVVGVALVVVCAGQVRGQCHSGGGGGQTATTSSDGGAVITPEVRLLTGPGSWAYDVLVSQRLQQAYRQQQMAIAVAQAQKKQADHERRLAAAQKRRAAETYQRQQDRDRRLAALASQQSRTSSTRSQ